ncbi:MAG: ABC transporter permease [Sarcina sp.]
MKVSDNVSMAFRDLNRRKKRTFLTSLGIIVGTVLIILMVSLGMMIKGFLVDTIDSGGSTKNITISSIKAGAKTPDDPKTMAKEMPLWLKENFKPLNNNLLQEVSKIKDVEAIKASIGGTLAKIDYDGKIYYGNFPIIGYDTNYSTYFDTDVNNAKSASKNKNFEPIIAGQNLKASDKNSIVIGESLLSKIGVTNPSTIIGKNIKFEIDNIDGKAVKPLVKEFKVVGVESKYMPDGNKFVMDSQDASQIVGFLQYTSEFMKTYGYNSVSVEVNNINNMQSVQNAITNIGYKNTSDSQKTAQINKNFNDILLVLAILGVIVLIVAGIGIINTMIMAVTERTKSIGVMKSVGANNADIRSIFLFQSGAIGLVGGVIGSVISVILFKLISMGIVHMLSKQGQAVNLLTSVPWWLVVVTILFSVIVSVLAGVYPANNAAKLDPIESLRQ